MKKYILECLDKYCDFNELSEQTYEYKIIDALLAAGCFKHLDWTYDAGVTKCVLIFSGLDFVVKIPFRGCHEYEYERWNDETQEYEELEEDNEKFYDFNLYSAGPEMAERYAEDHWDYCDIELDRTHLAEEEGLLDCFAPVELLGFAKEYPIYIQKRAVMFDSSEARTARSKKERSDEDFKWAEEIRQAGFMYVDSEWTLDFLYYFGVEIYRKLDAFCEKYGIEDLHMGNIGYIDGRPCLVDFSSYCGY